jgi:hypothetical protein
LLTNAGHNINRVTYPELAQPVEDNHTTSGTAEENQNVLSGESLADKKTMATKKRPKGVIYESPEKEDSPLVIDLERATCAAEDINAYICDKRGDQEMGQNCLPDACDGIDQGSNVDTGGSNTYTPYLYSGPSSSVKLDVLGSVPGKKKLFKFVNIPQASKQHDRTVKTEATISAAVKTEATISAAVKTEATISAVPDNSGIGAVVTEIIGENDLERPTSPLLFDSESNDALQPKCDHKDDNLIGFTSALKKAKEELDTKDSVGVTVAAKQPNTGVSRLSKFRYTKSSNSTLENDKEIGDEGTEIKIRRGRKRRGSFAKKEMAKKQNVDLLDQVDNLEKVSLLFEIYISSHLFFKIGTQIFMKVKVNGSVVPLEHLLLSKYATHARPKSCGTGHVLPVV